MSVVEGVFELDKLKMSSTTLRLTKSKRNLFKLDNPENHSVIPSFNILSFPNYGQKNCTQRTF